MTPGRDWQPFDGLDMAEAIDRIYGEYAEGRINELHEQRSIDPDFARRSLGSGWWEEISLRPAKISIRYNPANEGGFGTKVPKQLWAERERWLVEAALPLFAAVASGALSLSGYTVDDSDGAPAAASTRVPVPPAWFDLRQVLICRPASTLTPLDHRGFFAGNAIQFVKLGIEPVEPMVGVNVSDLAPYPDEAPAELLGLRYRDEDWPLLVEMRRRIMAHRVRSVRAAAKSVSVSAKGASREGSEDRLRRAYPLVPWDRWEQG